jgi:hypothetical protein
MGYRWRDLFVLGLSRLTGMRVQAVHRIVQRLGWR